MTYVNKPVRKRDAAALVTGKPVYTDDLAPKDALIVKLLRSPHPNAWVEEIRTEKALALEGVAAIYTWKDVPQDRFTLAGQTYPEFSPYDRLILDRHLRFVGDPVAIVAAETEKACDAALKRIRVKYRVEEPLLDMDQAKDSEILVHPEEDWKTLVDVGGDNRRNLCASGQEQWGDVDQVLQTCPYRVDRTYTTKANSQAMMETFRTCCWMDASGRLNVLSSTQIPFHVRRILGRALGIPSSKIRVLKPRIGGGFGAKQTAVCEVYAAFVTWKTGRASKIIYSRYESQTCGSPRHQMKIRVRAGMDEEGIVRALDVYTLSNAGAYGEHAATTIGLTAHKSIPLYSKIEAYRFTYEAVYTNVSGAGAFRGYGATQGIYAVETAVNELCALTGMDPAKVRELNMPREGSPLRGYQDLDIVQSCALDRCLARAKEMMDWDRKYPRQVLNNGKVRGVGVAMAMQGSSIAGVDVGGADLKLNEEGTYTLNLGCTDLGTGCDTILAQMAADVLETEMEKITVTGVDTDTSPYDSGSYASATTYATGNAVVQACMDLRKKIIRFGAGMLHCDPGEADFDGECVFCKDKKVSLSEIGFASTCGTSQELRVSRQFSSSISPPPFMVGMAEVEVDTETGSVKVIDYAGVVDCGTTVNPNLARVQTEGGIVQGIGMALLEDVHYSSRGSMMENSLMQYKIPSRMDVGEIRVDFCSSYEKTGPFGAKSIGELVIDTPCPAIANAIYNAVGIQLRDLPMTPEKVVMAIRERKHGDG